LSLPIAMSVTENTAFTLSYYYYKATRPRLQAKT